SAGHLREDVAVLVRQQDQRAYTADPRRGGRQLRHLPDSVRAVLHGAERSWRDGALRDAAIRGARLRGARVGLSHAGRNAQLDGQVREKRRAQRSRGCGIEVRTVPEQSCDVYFSVSRVWVSFKTLTLGFPFKPY